MRMGTTSVERGIESRAARPRRSDRPGRRWRILTGAWASLAIAAHGTASAQPDPCAAPARLVGGVFAELDGIVYGNPRVNLVPADARGVPLEGWTVLANGTTAPAEPPAGGWTPGAYDLVARGPDGCGEAPPVRLVIDGDGPTLAPMVAKVADLEGQVPDPGREKRFLWWWIQPDKQRLVWSDGATAWDSIRQRVGVTVTATPGRSRIFVWAPDESPFDPVARDQDLAKDRILVIEARDATSGIGALRLRLVEGKDAQGRPLDGHFRLVVEAADRVGNAISLELPYQAEESAGPRRGPF